VSILVDRATRVVVQGITGREGSFHTRQMLEYGTVVVAGVTPGKGGQHECGVPVFDDVATAVQQTGANTSVIYVPALSAAEAILEAAEAGIPLIVCITEGIPVWDMLRVVRLLEGRATRLVGPNCPGITSPDLAKVGIIPGHIHRRGPVGVISRSGTLTYEVVWSLTQAGLGQSTCLGIGGDPIPGSTFVDILRLFDDDPETEVVVVIGEIGGNAGLGKPVVAFVAGSTAPAGRRMGDAGAIIDGATGRAEDKISRLRRAGVHVADYPEQIAGLVAGCCR